MGRTCQVIAVLFGLGQVACGPGAAELRTRDARIATLEQDLSAAEGRAGDLEGEASRLRRDNEHLTRVLYGLAADAEQFYLEREDASQDLGRARQALEQLQGDNEALSGDLEVARRALMQLAVEEAQARMRAGQLRTLLARFQEMIDAGQLRVRVVRNRILVELPESVLFDSGRAEIRGPGQNVLDQVATVLAELDDRDFQVAGHTDNVPIRTRRYPSNWELSTARAVNVAHFLIDHGMNADRLSAAGYADTEPVADNETDEGRQQNRRIEIVLVPNYEELPDLTALERALDD